ncbi:MULTISPECIES: glutathione peroxidase [Flavobacterium]|jgi:glutathione peroxidase|uniref:Glutathione peroxidase n=1 Tax=Flavobacterium macrobrachii TaxID=591204 RepID=A0ABS2CYH6_9FLAO|nr:MULTISPECIES: glutathione peroxidase [Flavobacterium]MBM6499195.1 glutathione peroxidase [Flavobacterium macrobrachii]MCZ8090378.1 glutathione peroxidase [Flavobacterium sp.]
MKKLSLFLLISFLILSCQNQAQNQGNTAQKSNKKTTTMEKQTIYQFKVTDLYGNEFDFASLKGKKILIVNTASECGLTPQYKDLEAIYGKYKEKNFVIVGFPANNFGAQEPGSNEQIAAFCQKNYGVTFPMMEKISVKGNDKHELYQFLTEKSKNGLQDSDVEWNFQKYLINENGELVKVLSPRVLPTDTEIVGWINK